MYVGAHADGGGFAAPEIDPRAHPLEYIRSRWAEFKALPPKILELQHRAAVVAAQAGQAGDLEAKEVAQETVRDLGQLSQIHAAVMKQVETYGDFFGLSGLGALGLAPSVALIAGLALLIAWAITRYWHQSRIVDALEAGTIDADDLEALDSMGEPPLEFIGGLGDLGKLALWGLLAFLAYRLLSTGLDYYRPNPPLVTYRANPPGQIGADVHAIQYEHAEDGEPYEHEFEPGVEMWGEEDGSVTLVHPRKRLWRDF